MSRKREPYGILALGVVAILLFLIWVRSQTDVPYYPRFAPDQPRLDVTPLDKSAQGSDPS